MEKQTTKDWEEDFYESSWKPDTITDLSDMDKKFIEELTNFLPRRKASPMKISFFKERIK